MSMTWLIGMRRAGTSVMRRILNTAEGVKLIFEPHPLWFAVTHKQPNLHRLHRSPGILGVLQQFERHVEEAGVTGAKFALNPGLNMFLWPQLDAVYKRSRFVFVRRNQADTWASWVKLDEGSIWGTMPQCVHGYFHARIHDEWAKFATENPDRAVMVDFEEVIQNASTALAPVWRVLGTEGDHAAIHKLIRLPEQRRGLASTT